MKITGVIAEYNPFHNGHKYHIEQARMLSGADYVIAIISGDFTQRGTPAVIDKYTFKRSGFGIGIAGCLCCRQCGIFLYGGRHPSGQIGGG